MSTRVTAGVTDCFYGLKLNIVKNVAMTGGGGHKDTDRVYYRLILGQRTESQ